MLSGLHQQPESAAGATASTASGSPSHPDSNPTNDNSPASQAGADEASAHAPGRTNSAPHGLNARSCVTCRRRKVKCDKQVPCSNCAKAQTTCIFPAPGRAPRRPRIGGPAKPVSEREAELLKRLRRLEGVVQELSGQVELEGNKASPQSPNSSHKEGDGDSETGSKSIRVVGMDEGSSKRRWMSRMWSTGEGPPKSEFNLEHRFGRLVMEDGKSRYVSNPFWESIVEEVEEIRDILEDGLVSDEDSPTLPSDHLTDADHQSFIFSYKSSNVDLKGLHPLPSQIPFYWETFVENVNPLVKIIHVPTMNKVIKEIQGGLDSLSKSTEALMFAIYFATITSMSSEEVQVNFGVDKPSLLKRYRFGVEQALARAGFLNTNEIVTVQAFVLFLVCVRRHDDTRFVWSMTGLAIRVAQSLGLHRDGTKLGLCPFDIEMRRRLWWQICVLDVRASEDHGHDPSILQQSFDTEFPTSINDVDINPDSKTLPEPRPGVSELTFCLIRYEICSCQRALQYCPPDRLTHGKGEQSGPTTSKLLTLEEKEAIIKECADRLENKYLQYCTNAGPLYWVAATTARLIMSKMSLVIYYPLIHPSRPQALHPDIRDRLFMAAIEIIEYSRALQNEGTTKKWGWLFHTYVQWHAIAFILSELSVRQPSIVVDRAWRSIDQVFSELQTDNRSSILWIPMRKLMAKARKRREEDAQIFYPEHGLGMNPRFYKPEAASSGLSVVPGFSDVGQQRQLLEHPELFNQLESVPATTSVPSSSFLTTTNTQPADITGLNTLQAQLDQQARQLQNYGQTPVPWPIFDESILADIDMNDLNGDVNWEGWDSLVQDIQQGSNANTQAGVGSIRGPQPFGEMRSWW
ncbi:fungal-specific transcription factor domain-containing protein [Xylogone sp. PMI_703]|nr:fungal-specific transcription factor domain-containing protein [Xylogone sp. PMI_703]